jgi:hypothetical protein
MFVKENLNLFKLIPDNYFSINLQQEIDIVLVFCWVSRYFALAIFLLYLLQSSNNLERVTCFPFVN